MAIITVQKSFNSSGIAGLCTYTWKERRDAIRHSLNKLIWISIALGWFPLIVHLTSLIWPVKNPTVGWKLTWLSQQGFSMSGMGLFCQHTSSQGLISNTQIKESYTVTYHRLTSGFERTKFALLGSYGAHLCLKETMAQYSLIQENKYLTTVLWIRDFLW